MNRKKKSIPRSSIMRCYDESTFSTEWFTLSTASYIFKRTPIKACLQAHTNTIILCIFHTIRVYTRANTIHPRFFTIYSSLTFCFWLYIVCRHIIPYRLCVLVRSANVNSTFWSTEYSKRVLLLDKDPFFQTPTTIVDSLSSHKLYIYQICQANYVYI